MFTYCKWCNEFFKKNSFEILSFSEITTLPEKPAVYFILAIDKGAPIEIILSAINIIKESWKQAWKNAGSTLERIKYIPKHLKTCNTIYIGSTLNLAKRYNALSFSRDAHVARPAIYALALYGWKFALAYKTIEEKTLERITEILELEPTNTNLRKALSVIQTIVAISYVKTHKRFPPLSKKIGAIESEKAINYINARLKPALQKLFNINEIKVDEILDLISKDMNYYQK